MNSRNKLLSVFFASTLGLTLWIWFLSSLALSEPYTVKKGDTLAMIAHHYRVTVSRLSAVNHIPNPNLIRVGQVLTIPEGYSAVRVHAATAPHHGAHTGHARYRQARLAATADPARIQALRNGLDNGWVVSENPDHPGKLFVHASSSGGFLTDLRYLMQVNSNGTWTVFAPRYAADGSTEYGRRVGVMDPVTTVSVGQCTCE